MRIFLAFQEVVGWHRGWTKLCSHLHLVRRRFTVTAVLQVRLQGLRDAAFTSLPRVRLCINSSSALRFLQLVAPASARIRPQLQQYKHFVKMPTEEENTQYLYLVLTHGGNPKVSNPIPYILMSWRLTSRPGRLGRRRHRHGPQEGRRL